MTRQEYLDDFKKIYQFMHAWENKPEYSVFHYRHRELNKDIVVRSYSIDVSAYKELLDVDCVNLPQIYDVIKFDDGIIVLE
jgi:hypothetical protein